MVRPLVLDIHELWRPDARCFGGNQVFSGDITAVYGYYEAAKIMKQARQLGMSIQFFNTAMVLSPPLIAASGTALEGTRFSVVMPSNERPYSGFRDAFQKHYSTLPVLDTANLTVSFTNEFKGEVGSASYHDELKSFPSSVKNCEGASGRLEIDHDGGTRSLVVRTYEVRQGTRRLSNLPK